VRNHPSRLQVFSLFSVFLCLGACGIKGPPQPPLIRMAEKTRDLSIVQDGETATLTWSYPQMTSAGDPLPDLEEIDLWRVEIPLGQEPSMADTARDRGVRINLIKGRGEIIARLAGDSLDEATRGSMLEFREDFSPWLDEDSPKTVLWYAVVTVCCSGRQSEFSNIARIEPAVPAPPPEDLSGTPEAEGIRLAWTPPETEMKISLERSPDGTNWEVVETGALRGESFLDTGVEQGRTWQYRARFIVHETGGAVHLGRLSDVVQVEYPDVYPPAPPTELICLPENGRVRLRWLASPEAVGYWVERVTSTGKSKILAKNHEGLSLVDNAPPAGELIYHISAVDAAGNTSEHVECRSFGGRKP